MIDIIKNNIDFIVWENFTRVGVYANWIIALGEIFLFVFLSILISQLILPAKNNGRYFKSLIAQFAFRTAVGMAVFAFFIAFIALVGGLYPSVLLISLVLMLIFTFFKQREAFSESALLLKKALWNYKYLWILFLLVSQRGLLPPIWFDEVSYHLTYPLIWVKAGAITVEPSMRYPLYTFNYHSLLVIGEFLNNTDFSHLLSWLCGVLTSLGILGLLERFKAWKPLRYIAALAYFITPMVQQYMARAYLDMALVFFLFISVYGIILLRQSQAKREIYIAAALVAAMFVGIKPSGAFFVPLFFWAVWYRQKLRKVLPFLLVFSVFGGLWYLRNIVIDHDPIPPSINVRLGLEDKYWNAEDYRLIFESIDVKHNWKWYNIWYKLPAKMVTNYADQNGTQLLGNSWPLLGYIFIFPLSLFFIFKFRRKPEYLILFGFAIYAALVWASLSIFIRYAHFIGLAVACSAIIIDDVFLLIRKKQEKPWLKVALVLLAIFLLAGPKHYALSYLKNNFNKKIPLNREQKYDLVGWGEPALLELIDQFDELGVKKGERIYGIRLTQLKYYYEKAGYHIIGDDVNKYRFRDFKTALHNGEVVCFLHQADCKYLLIDDSWAGRDNLELSAFKQRKFQGLKLIKIHTKYVFLKVEP